MSAGPIFSQFDPRNQGSQPGSPARWPDHLARRARELAHAAGKRAFGEEEPGALGENARYRAGFLAFQRWSPLVAPLLLGGLLLVLALVLTAHGMERPYTLAWEGGPGALVVLAVVAGALLGALLAIAPNDALWLGALIAGAVLFVAAMVCALFGYLAGIMPIALVAGLGFYYVRKHQCDVIEGSIVLTARKGSFLRTLYPGNNLLWPGEQVLATLETGQRIYTSPTQKVQVRATDGAQYRASASAIVSYAFIPQEVEAVARSLNTWERDLHQLIAVALQEALQQWSTHQVSAGGQAPAGLVARWVLDEVRGWARASGIWVAWVRVAHLQLGPGWERLEAPVSARRGTPRLAQAASAWTGYQTPPPAAGQRRAPSGADYIARVSRPRSAPRLPAMHEASARKAVMGQPAPASYDPYDPYADASTWEEDAQRNADLEQLTPDALADVYEAIRDGHINDSETIREVARAFARLAQDPALDHDLAYEPAAAADALLHFAAQIERHNASLERMSRPSSGTDIYAPTQDLSQDILLASTYS